MTTISTHDGEALRISKKALHVQPLRRAKASIPALDAWDKRARLGPEQTYLKQSHVAGKSSSLEDAYPFKMMFFDLLKGVYGKFFKLSKELKANLVGDAHLTNFGGAMTVDGNPQPVITVTDPTKGGTGNPLYDLARLTATSVITARKNKLARNERPKVALAAVAGYMAALKKWADSETGEKPAGYLEMDELDPQSPNRKLLQDTGAAVPDAGVAKNALNEQFKADLRLEDPAERAKVTAAFLDYVSRLPDALQNSIQILDIGHKVNVGGSNSGLIHYYVLSRVTMPGKEPSLRKFEIKQGVPAPSDTKSGKPSRTMGKRTTEIARQGTTINDPFLGYAKIDNVARIITEDTAQTGALNLKKLNSKDLQLVAREYGTALARFHMQSMDLAAVRQWINKTDVDAEKAKIVSFALTYARQSEEDAKALKTKLAKRPPPVTASPSPPGT